MALFSERIALAISADSGGAVTPLSRLEKQAKGTETAFDKMSRSIGVSSTTLKRGLVSLGSAALGAGLVAGVQQMVTGYAQAAKAAGDLANAVGGTPEEVSRLQAALVDAGVSAEESAKLMTKFVTVAGSSKGADTLRELNVQLVRGKDGIVDYAATMTHAVDAIMQIGDAAQRNQQFVTLFGKQGAQAFQDLLASGMSLSQAAQSISAGRLFSAADVANAAAYDEAMDSTTASMQELGNALGRSVLPGLNTMLGLVTPLVSGVASLGGSTVLLATGAVLLAANQGRAVAALGAAGAAMRALGNTAVKPLTVDYAGLTLATNTYTVALERQAAMTAAASSSRGLAGVVAGISKGSIIAAVAWAAMNEAVSRAQTNLEEFGATSRQVNAETVAGYNESLSLFERWGLDVEEFKSNWTNFLPGVGLVRGVKTLWDETFGGGNLDTRQKELEEYQRKQREAVEAQGAYAVAALDAKEAQDALNNLIAAGVTSGEEFASAVVAAGDALAAQDQNARLAAQALDMYRASTDQAYESTLKLLDLNRSERSAQRSAEGASDAAADAKANLDQTLATAKAAKTVVEKITAIQGRARRRQEEEGIVKGSIDVSAVEGQKGRRGGTRTRVTEAAGVITPEEARQIRQATRDYEDAIDDIAAAWENLAQVRIKHKEALGINLAEVEKLAIVRDALKEGLQVPGLSKTAKAAINADLAVVEAKINQLGGEPILIDGIRFKDGTTAEQVAKLQGEIGRAFSSGNVGLAAAMQRDLDSLKWTGVPPMPVQIVGPDGKPLGSTAVDIPVTATGAAAAAEALAAVWTDPATGRPREATVNVTIPPDHIAAAAQQIAALTVDPVTGADRVATILAQVDEGEAPAQLGALMLDPVTGRDRIATIDAQLNAGTVAAELDQLARDREMTITVNYLPGAGADLPGLNATQTVRMPASSRPNAISLPARGAGAVFAPTVINHYPRPERASDSVAMSLRTARHMAGLS